MSRESGAIVARKVETGGRAASPDRFCGAARGFWRKPLGSRLAAAGVEFAQEVSLRMHAPVGTPSDTALILVTLEHGTIGTAFDGAWGIELIGVGQGHCEQRKNRATGRARALVRSWQQHIRATRGEQ